jgi:hypothetical protein
MNSLARPVRYAKPMPPSLRYRAKRMNLTVKSAIDMKGILGVEATKNPTLSTSYRPMDIPTPNRMVLEAQQRVCTGPSQTRPLDQAQTISVLDTIVRSGVL